ncbi:hypothetical protein LT493_02260 [Streptomyces tricolor]|nr:hypothetical protein [Streptomyces tricolor]
MSASAPELTVDSLRRHPHRGRRPGRVVRRRHRHRHPDLRRAGLRLARADGASATIEQRFGVAIDEEELSKLSTPEASSCS